MTSTFDKNSDRLKDAIEFGRYVSSVGRPANSSKENMVGDTCPACNSDLADAKAHATVCMIGDSQLASELYPKVMDLIMAELIPAHAEQLRKGIKNIDECTVPGDVVVRVVTKALMSKSDV